MTSDGVYETAEGDNAPVICNINNDGHITDISCQSVEAVSADVDLSVLDARCAGLTHAHDDKYAGLTHAHDDRYVLLSDVHSQAVSVFQWAGSNFYSSAVVTKQLLVALQPVSFLVNRSASGYLPAFGLQGGAFNCSRHLVGSPCSWENYSGSWAWSGGVLSLTSQARYVDYVGVTYIIYLFF